MIGFHWSELWMLGGWFFMYVLRHKKVQCFINKPQKLFMVCVCVCVGLLKGNVHLKMCLCVCVNFFPGVVGPQRQICYTLFKMYALMKCGTTNGREKKTSKGNANFEWNEFEKVWKKQHVRKTGSTQIIGRQSQPLLIRFFYISFYFNYISHIYSN